MTTRWLTDMVIIMIVLTRSSQSLQTSGQPAYSVLCIGRNRHRLAGSGGGSYHTTPHKISCDNHAKHRMIMQIVIRWQSCQTQNDNADCDKWQSCQTHCRFVRGFNLCERPWKTSTLKFNHCWWGENLVMYLDWEYLRTDPKHNTLHILMNTVILTPNYSTLPGENLTLWSSFGIRLSSHLQSCPIQD